MALHVVLESWLTGFFFEDIKECFDLRLNHLHGVGTESKRGDGGEAGQCQITTAQDR